MGADPNQAAAGGAAFESAMKRVEAILGALGTRVETNLFDVIKPCIDAVAQWVLDHGDSISKFIDTTAKGLGDLADAFVKSDAVKGALASLNEGLEGAAKYVASDAFRKDVQAFVEDVQSLAHAIRTALEWIGVLPDRNGETIGEGAKPVSFVVPPSGITPSVQTSYNNSRILGDTNITHNPTFNITGHDTKAAMDSARIVADRGTRDLVRNMRAVET